MSRRLYTIAPHARFLDVLADRILDGALLGDWPRQGPFWLSDVTIVLPTRRSRLALAEAFMTRGHILLPDIRTFGGEVADEEPFLPPFDLPPLPPAVTVLERRLVLSRLVAAWADSPAGRDAFSSPPTAAEILGFSESLGQLVDELAAEGRTKADLAGIVPTELAANWQQTLAFLSIALDFWPAELEERGKADAAQLRNERLDRQAGAAAAIFGERPVIAAGSTGSIPATARLLAAIENLPRGALVLPGLDTSLTPVDHRSLLDPIAQSQGHPQYGLAKLLRGLDAGIGDVVELAPDCRHRRTQMVRLALASTDATADWSTNRLTPDACRAATEGLSILAARTEDEEARAIALAAREGLALGHSVGIVTPDQTLARRIAAELARFEIAVDDAAGQPLFQSPAGRLVRQILVVACGNFSPVDVIGLLRNRASQFGRPRAEIAAIADLIELGLLRGQRPGPGIAGLLTLLAANIDKSTKHPAKRLVAEDGPRVAGLLGDIGEALAGLRDICEGHSLQAATLAEALRNSFLKVVAGGEPLPGTDEFLAFCDALTANAGEGLRFPPRQLEQVLAALMAGHEVRNTVPRRDDIAIWGQLEARLQSPDLMIIAALNEDKWPEPADPGPWLSRGMRIAAGLEPPERKQGLAAHDFEMALGNAEVILAFSERLGASPAIASRLVQRLEAFVGEDVSTALRLKGQIWRDAARALDAVPAEKPAPIPAPNPPVAIRPRKLSITEIETLFRSPYDIYAKYVLDLREMDRLGDDPGARERGTLIHRIFGDFIMGGHDVMSPEALDRLNALAREAFAGLDAIADRRDIWLNRFERAAQMFLDFERARNHLVAQRHAELDGQWQLPLAEPFTLKGRADRIDLLADGTVEILDFKTGSIPTGPEMQAFDAPQLLLEAAMTRAGAMEGIVAAPASALTYIKIGLGPDAFVPSEFKPPKGMSLDEAIGEASRRTQAFVTAMLYTETAMIAQIRPSATKTYAGPYEHLARMAEWSLAPGEEGP